MENWFKQVVFIVSLERGKLIGLIGKEKAYGFNLRETIRSLDLEMQNSAAVLTNQGRRSKIHSRWKVKSRLMDGLGKEIGYRDAPPHAQTDPDLERRLARHHLVHEDAEGPPVHASSIVVLLNKHHWLIKYVFFHVDINWLAVTFRSGVISILTAVRWAASTLIVHP